MPGPFNQPRPPFNPLNPSPGQGRPPWNPLNPGPGQAPPPWNPLNPVPGRGGGVPWSPVPRHPAR